MKATISWVIFVPCTVIILLVLGYMAWRRNSLSASRRSQRGSLANEQQTGNSQIPSSADEWIAFQASQKAGLQEEATQVKPSQEINPAEERTQMKPPRRRVNPAEERTQMGQSQGENPAEERTQIGPARRVNPAEERTQMGRPQNNKINPEDDRTTF